jgi:hypothetical protein
MQASTASACLRKLSDWVNSVRSSQASFLVIVFKCFPLDAIVLCQFRRSTRKTRVEKNRFLDGPCDALGARCWKFGKWKLPPSMKKQG